MIRVDSRTGRLSQKKVKAGKIVQETKNLIRMNLLPNKFLDTEPIRTNEYTATKTANKTQAFHRGRATNMQTLRGKT